MPERYFKLTSIKAVTQSTSIEVLFIVLGIAENGGTCDCFFTYNALMAKSSGIKNLKPFYLPLTDVHSTSLALYQRRAKLVCLNSLLFNTMDYFI